MSNQMSKKPPALHLKASIGNKLFVLGTLSYNLNKKEVSFYFHPSSKTQLDLDSGQQTDPIDHITWHEREMHIRTKRKILQTVPYPNGSLFQTPGTILPMYVEGFFLNGDTSILCDDSRLGWKANSDEVLILDQEVPLNFSLIFLLVPSERTTENIVLGSHVRFKDGSEIPLFYLRTATHEIGRIKPFEGWDMLVFTTPYTCATAALDSRLGSTCRLPDFISPVSSLTSILQQAKAKPSLDEETIKELYLLKDGPAI
jgi:hypothetical protein